MTTRGPSERRAQRRRRLGAAALIGAMLAGALLALPGLKQRRFWDDEANTAIYARNLLDTGRLTAFDGTNLVGYAQGGSLGPDLGRELRVPGAPAYVAATGMRVLGKNTFGGRAPFVLLGVLSVGLLGLWTRRWLGRSFPFWLPAALLAVSPAFLLYARNCRYYALSTALTLLFFALWTPWKRRERPALGWLLRSGGAVLAVWLLIHTQYLNAAAALAAAPLFFFHRRFRRPSQYALLAVVYAAAAVQGIWLLATASPFSADYAAPGTTEGWGTHFLRHFLLMLRDLGTHEFFPWTLVFVFALPWFVGRWRRLRPASIRGMTLLAVTLLYVVLAAALTPPDMGKGETAEMRYVVPVIALGAALASLAIWTLWRIGRPWGVVALLLLVSSNTLHLGFLFDRRPDRRSAWLHPTLYRYVAEIWTDEPYVSGPEAMVDLLARLPEGTPVRIRPEYMPYPPMFYAPHLHYCDQWSERRPLDASLEGKLPDHVYVERAEPDVVLMPASTHPSQIAGQLPQRKGAKFRPLLALPGCWHYTTKPEIPAHFFAAPAHGWDGYPTMVVWVDVSRPIAQCDAWKIAPGDGDAHHRLGTALAAWGMLPEAVVHYARAIEADPQRAQTYVDLGRRLALNHCIDEAGVHLGLVLKMQPVRRDEYLIIAGMLTERRAPMAAVPYYGAILSLDPDDLSARIGMGLALSAACEWDDALRHLRRAAEDDPDSVAVRLYLAETLGGSGAYDEAIQTYREALGLAEPGSATAQAIRAALEELAPDDFDVSEEE